MGQNRSKDQLYAALLYGVNIPGGIRLTCKQVELKLRGLSDNLEFVRCVGDADNILLRAKTDEADSRIIHQLRALLGVKALTVVSLGELRQILDEAKRELKARGVNEKHGFRVISDSGQWEFGLVLSSEVLPQRIQDQSSYFEPKKNVLGIRLICGRALLVQKRCSTATGSRIMFGQTAIGPWRTFLSRNGVSPYCLTSRSMGRIDQIVSATDPQL